MHFEHSWSMAVPTKGLSFRLAAVLVLAVTQTTVVERASARVGGAGGSSGGHAVGSHVGHFVASNHFDHPRFGHRLRKNPFFVSPFGWGWDWPYADYGSAPNATATSIVAYPPPLWSAHARDDCRWNEDTFNVPSSAGGTLPIQVVSCR